MEFVLWLVLIAAFIYSGRFILQHPEVFRVIKERIEQGAPKKDEWADFKRYVVEHRKVREQMHREWLAEYKELLQKNCNHIYHHQNWYTCFICGYIEPWKHNDDCRCRTATDQTLTQEKRQYVLMERESYCKVHGIDFSGYPFADRTSGNYGPRGNQIHGGMDAVNRSKELTEGRSMRKIDFLL